MESFRTKRGQCVLTPHELRLESSWRGYFRRYYEGQNWLFVLKMFSLGIVLYNVWELTAGSFQSGIESTMVVGVFVAVVVGLGRAYERFRGFTRESTIPITAIHSVEAKPGGGLKPPRFVLHYRENNLEKKRRITLPSPWLSYTDEEFERAKVIFFDEHDLSIPEP